MRVAMKRMLALSYKPELREELRVKRGLRRDRDLNTDRLVDGCDLGWLVTCPVWQSVGSEAWGSVSCKAR